MCYVTNLPLEKAVAVTKEEIQGLVGRAIRDEVAGPDDPAIYLLYCLAPERALEEMARRFRKSPHSPDMAKMLAEYLLKPGMRKGKIRKLMGEPDWVEGPVWGYSCVEDSTGLQENHQHLLLSLRFRNKALESATYVGSANCLPDIRRGPGNAETR